MDLHAKRDRLRADHEAMEKYDPHWKAAAEKGDRVSERPVAFLCDDEIVVVGGDVARVLDGLRAFGERAAEYEDRATREPAVAQARALAARLLEGGLPGELRMSQQRWNACLFALGEAGVNVVLTDGGNE